jgi:predicted amidohydrolase YtcJ
VVDRVYNGSLISTWIDECSSIENSHGDLDSCVARLTRKLTNLGIINGEEKSALQKCAQKQSTTILYNALIYTMENDPYIVEAIFIKGNKIKAVGTNEKILAMAKKNTLRIDLGGRTVFPGFIDPHTHLFNEYPSQNITLDEAQQLALESGITSVANMYTDKYWLEDIMQYAQDGNMRLRLYLYLNYNHSCGEIFGTWYEDYAPRVEYAPKVWVNGVKIMAERSVCEGMGVRPVFSEALLENFTDYGLSLYEDSQLHLSLDELTTVIQRANDNGYQVAIHAIGDLGIETSLLAINSAINDSANKYRHMVLHNYFIRDDMLDMYAENNIVALVESTSPCHANSYVARVGEPNRRLFKRWRDLVDTGIHVGLNSDWPYFGLSGLNPMRKLYAVVTGKNGFEAFEVDEPCEPPIEDQTISVLKGLKMMTIEAAYAVHVEKRLGSIKKGKIADLVVLSDNPFYVDPNDIKTIEVLMTIIDGKIEFESKNLP